METKRFELSQVVLASWMMFICLDTIYIILWGAALLNRRYTTFGITRF
jgi:hypothetical protein